MISALGLIVALCSPVDASSRPTTFPVDPQLTASPAANFRELFVDPAALAKTLTPESEKGSPAADLTIPNPRAASAVVTVSDIKVGILGPLTDGLISGIASGSYTVSLTYSTGYVHTMQAQAVAQATAPTEAPEAADDEAAE